MTFETEVKSSEETVVKVIASALADGVEKHYSNILINTVKIVQLKVSELKTSPRYVKEENEFTYTLV